MEAEVIGTLIETLGLPIAIIVVLLTLVWFLINHLFKNTVPTSVYNQVCQNQHVLEEAIDRNTEAVNAVTEAQAVTNTLVGVLVGRDGK